MKKTLRDNGLSIMFVFLFLVSFVGQVFNGLKEHNKEMIEEGGPQVSLTQYFSTGHFLQSTFENWESEFLQMALFVVMTIFLYQKGSSESKDPEGGEEEVDKEPDPNKKEAPWAVRQGGVILSLYKHSLTIALFVLYFLSFILHWYGSLKAFNQEQSLKGQSMETAWQYLGNSRLWFESFQNWQSEFLSVFVIIALSIYLRQKGSPQSKPVDAPHKETGE
jgi:hypothetical protein